MNKSSAFYMAQLSVLTDELISNNDKLAILRVLQASEDMARFSEKKEKE